MRKPKPRKRVKRMKPFTGRIVVTPDGEGDDGTFLAYGCIRLNPGERWATVRVTELRPKKRGKR